MQFIFQAMEQTEKHTQSNENTKNWLFFCIGLLVGFVLSFSIYFVDKYVFNEKIHFSQTVEHLYAPLRHNAEEPQAAPASESASKEAKPSHPIADSDSTLLPDELSDEAMENAEEADETEFESLETDDEVDVYADEIVAERKIRVVHADTLQQKIIEYFEVEQWSSPIKNRHTYQLHGAVLKISGLDINKVKLCYIDQHYYLQYQNTFYRLQENKEFEKLIESKPKFENAD